MRTHSRSHPHTTCLIGSLIWWLYNVGMLLGMLVCLPLLFSMVSGSKKRRKTFRQRIGLLRPALRVDRAVFRDTIWVHALSVGEVTAAKPLIQGLIKRYPRNRVVLSASTYTGYKTAVRLFGDADVELTHFPYDLLFSVRTITDSIDPCLVILVETDIWPNFVAEMRRRKVPLFLVNFRLSDSTWRFCRAFKGFSRHLFESFDKIYTQTREDAGKIGALGVREQRLFAAGSLKFDMTAHPSPEQVEQYWRQRLHIEPGRPVIVAGSTHEGDESALFRAFTSIREATIDALMIIAPRDPGRCREVYALCRKFNLDCGYLSEIQSNPSASCPDVVLVDYMGVLNELYSIATIAFVGGSLSNEGGHNPLEAAAFGKPIVFGPDMRDFMQIAAWLVEHKGARQIEETQMFTVFQGLLNDPQMTEFMGRQSLMVFDRHKGAADKILDDLGCDAAVSSDVKDPS